MNCQNVRCPTLALLSVRFSLYFNVITVTLPTNGIMNVVFKRISQSFLSTSLRYLKCITPEICNFLWNISRWYN
uniref:Uncharacterized protein n=1 Tax=Anguilla anguilla TaxID=7936 RepID=A0A0E9Q3R0_ANGAN